ncbi:MAG: phage portal protein, partial [Oscillospiraceae bacterium]|nr:phage portal protein [Oscillospiraceae bacterium]
SGLEFQESSATSVELQLNENKETNAAEFAKLFHISPESIAGRATEQDTASIARLAAIPLMKAIQCALNKDLLLEKEKPTHYFAFDTKELLRGDLQGRYNAYKTALDANFLQIDEVRYSEDLEPLGLNWIKLGLQDVLYDPKSKTIFTPNTGEFRQMEGDDDPAVLQEPGVDATMEERGNGKNATRKKNGQFSGSTPKVPKCYRVGKRELHRLTHEIATIYPTLKPGPKRYPFENRNHFYVFSVKGFGAYEYHLKVKIEGNEEWIRMQHVALKSNEEDQG